MQGELFGTPPQITARCANPKCGRKIVLSEDRGKTIYSEYSAKGLCWGCSLDSGKEIEKSSGKSGVAVKKG